MTCGSEKIRTYHLKEKSYPGETDPTLKKIMVMTSTVETTTTLTVFLPVFFAEGKNIPALPGQRQGGSKRSLQKTSVLKFSTTLKQQNWPCIIIQMYIIFEWKMHKTEEFQI